jgi:hypothetical protein
VTTESKDDVLVYDTQTHHIHHLNQISAAVWRLCDGRRTLDDVTREMQASAPGGVGEDVVRLALTKLESANLLDSELDSSLRAYGQSRRKFLRRAAVAGAIAVPVVVSMTAPQAAFAGSTSCGQSCVDDGLNSECNGNCSQCGQETGRGCGSVCCSPGGGSPHLPNCSTVPACPA